MSPIMTNDTKYLENQLADPNRDHDTAALNGD